MEYYFIMKTNKMPQRHEGAKKRKEQIFGEYILVSLRLSGK
jgi:hypothetical protein